MSRFVVVDVETTGLNPRKDLLHGVGIRWDDNSFGYYMTIPERLQKLCQDPDMWLVGHNLRFDLKFLRRAGLKIACKIGDTKLLAQLINENRELGLKALSETYFGADSLEAKRELDRAISSIGGKQPGDLCRADLNTPNQPFKAIISKYCLEDVRNTAELWKVLTKNATDIDQAMRKLDYKYTILDYYLNETMPLEQVLLSVEEKGIAFDESRCTTYRKQLESETSGLFNQLNEVCLNEIKAVEEDLYEKACSSRKSDRGKAQVERGSDKYKTRFNWQSNDHLASLIFDQFGVSRRDVERTDTGKPSVSESSLAGLVSANIVQGKARIALETYGKYKKNVKLLSTYVGEDSGLPSQVDGGRIYAEYMQAGHGRESSTGGTVTGRLSSKSPNMQNLPRGSEIRRFFVPDPGKVFIYFDYSQLELRLAAHLSQDQLLIKAYNEGLDLHKITAEHIGEERQVGKTVNFAMIYDASSYRLAQILEKSPEECQDIIDGFYGLYSGYKGYLGKQRQAMLRTGRVVSETGRIRRLPELISERPGSREWKHALKQGYNFPIQSLGASITKRAMIECYKQGYEIVTQVHDSVVIQVPKEQAVEEAKKIEQIAQNIYQLSVPLIAETKILTSLNEADMLPKGGTDNG